MKKVPKEIIKKTTKVSLNEPVRNDARPYDPRWSIQTENDSEKSRPEKIQINTEEIIKELKPAFF